MEEKLEGYAVIGALFGAYREATEERILHLKDRQTLYETIYDLCLQQPEHVSDFDFCRRSGHLTSPDIDLVIRNLEDSKMLECLNPGLVDFRCTDILVKEYEGKWKQELSRWNLLTLFQESARQLTPAS